MNKEDKNKFEPGKIEKHWQEVWEKEGTFSPDIDNAKHPYYNLMMFPYPSAEGLHVGNMYAFTGADVYARYNRMQGKDVLEPIGLDGFGIHSENYAIKVGRHPKEQAQIAENNFYRQLHSIGNSFDWHRTVETYDPNYYKWTQWLFIQLFKAGLAYRKVALVNWCPSCKTVLSDEQVLQKSKIKNQKSKVNEKIKAFEVTVGVCERCGTEVEKKNLEQWFFRITDYAEKLLQNIEKLDWPEKIKIAQRNWIGKSEGAEVGFRVEGLGDSYELKVFTTRPDTLFGATFMVIAPEHELVGEILRSARDDPSASSLHSGGQAGQAKIKEVTTYIEATKSKTEMERTAEGKEKTGVFTGIYAINPVNNERIPIWIADYVLSGYGTGAIMAVPAHDERDFAFATKYDLPIIEVIQNSEIRNQKSDQPYEGDGVLINSGDWNGWKMPNEMSKVLDWVEQKGVGTRKSNYHLRDWLISRQRYWGPPIPMIFCRACYDAKKSWFKSSEYSDSQTVRLSESQKVRNSESSEFSEMAGWFPVPESDLPVLLPDVADWKPMGTGKAPLANHPEFYNTTCPSCGGEALRETDVSDTFLDSSWYFLRYPSTDILTAPFDTLRSRKWLPVDMYIGGAEHAVLHLLYSRFVTLVLNKLNLVDFEEPFPRLFAHGLIIKDGAKMSKSKGNVVVPDQYIAKYGADSLRAYLMFLGPYSEGGDFRDSGIEGMHRFIKKVWRLFSEAQMTNDKLQILNKIPNEEIAKLDTKMHQTIKDVTEDIQNFKYNTSIARLMEYYNVLSEFYSKFKNLDSRFCRSFLLLLAPFAPHMTEELWQRLKHESRSMNQESAKINGDHDSLLMIHNSIHLSSWPKYDEKYLQADTIIIPVQINGKRRGEIQVQSSNIKNQSEVEEMAKEAVAKNLSGLEIKNTIYVPGKIVNFVV